MNSRKNVIGIIALIAVLLVGALSLWYINQMLNGDNLTAVQDMETTTTVQSNGSADQPEGLPMTGAETPEEAEPTAGAGSALEYPNGNLLVSTDWLKDHLDDPEVRILDVRSPGEYAQGHIPGAVNVPVGEIVSEVNEVPFMYDTEAVQNAINLSGLTPEMTAVIYDNLGMMNAARLFWTLEYVGHEDPRILNGGWNAWVDATRMDASEQISESPTEVEESNYPLEPDPDKVVTAEEVVGSLDDDDSVIVDARSPQEYTGEVRLAERGGHIPGAVNLVWLDFLTGGDTVYTIEPDWQAELADEDVEVFKPADEIQAMLDQLDIDRDQEVITYCQTFWRGAHMYFLFRLMGFENVSGYDGSWVEWGNRTDLPVVQGEEPDNSTANP